MSDEEIKKLLESLEKLLESDKVEKITIVIKPEKKSK